MRPSRDPPVPHADVDSIPDLVESEPERQRSELRQREQRIRVRYAELSDQYQLSKGDNDIPLN